MKTLIQLWRKISFLGIKEKNMDLQEFKTRVFFNRSMAILGLLSIPQVISVNLLVSNLGFLHLVWGITCYLCLFLVSRGLYNVAKYIILIVVMISGSIASTVIGPETNSHIGLLSVLIFGVILFRKHLIVFLWVAIPIIVVSVTLTELNLFDQNFTGHPDILSSRFGAFYTQIAIISLLMAFIVRLNLDQEKLLKEKNALLKVEVNEREVLLTEVHHRVKNNLQVINSLMSLQAGKSHSEETISVIEKSQEQIRSIARIHEKLYSSDSFSEINFGSYLEKLKEDYEQIYDLESRNIQFSIAVENVLLDLNKSAPCGILMNELITNSIKYAFDEKGGELCIIGRVEKDFCIIEVKDNGIGLPDNLKDKMKDSVGLQLSMGLAKQIGGNLEMKNDNGAHFLLKFKLK